MEQLTQILTAISNGIKNPTMAVIGVVASLFGYIFYAVIKGKAREQGAQQHKEEAKQDNINQLEQKTEQATNTARDRLSNRRK